MCGLVAVTREGVGCHSGPVCGLNPWPCWHPLLVALLAELRLEAAEFDGVVGLQSGTLRQLSGKADKAGKGAGGARVAKDSAGREQEERGGLPRERTTLPPP